MSTVTKDVLYQNSQSASCLTLIRMGSPKMSNFQTFLMGENLVTGFEIAHF